MRILVTGGAGFIGSHLCDRLLAEGHDVIAMDNLITGSTDNIAHLVGNRIPVHPPRRDRLYLRRRAAGRRDAPGLAGQPGRFHGPDPDAQGWLARNAQRAGAGEGQGAAPYLFASTSEVYGDPLVHPQPETYWGNVNPIGLRGVYDEAKRFAEAMTMAYHRIHGVETRIVRIFNTYGPRMRLNDGRVVPTFVGQALRGEPLTVYGDGKQTRCFCYVSDLGRGHARLLMSDETEPVNVGNPVELTILAFAETINRLTGNPAGMIVEPLPADDPASAGPTSPARAPGVGAAGGAGRRSGADDRVLPLEAIVRSDIAVLTLHLAVCLSCKGASRDG